MPLFGEYIGIDYSGAEYANHRIRGLEVFRAEGQGAPRDVRPEPEHPGWKWSRELLHEWLLKHLTEAGARVVVGIDHGFSFPLSYMKKHGLTSWPGFLADFVKHWPTHKTWVEGLREGNSRTGESGDLRLTEKWTQGARSVFTFDCQGQVAKSTHAGLPWLRELRNKTKGKVHFWPFDGVHLPEGKSVVAEVYPAILKRRYESPAGLNEHARDAWAVATWLQDRDGSDLLAPYFSPPLTEEERERTRLEGWILGVA